MHTYQETFVTGESARREDPVRCIWDLECLQIFASEYGDSTESFFIKSTSVQCDLLWNSFPVPWNPFYYFSCLIMHFFFFLYFRLSTKPKEKKLFTNTACQQTCPSSFRLKLMPTISVRCAWGLSCWLYDKSFLSEDWVTFKWHFSFRICTKQTWKIWARRGMTWEPMQFPSKLPKLPGRQRVM